MNVQLSDWQLEELVADFCVNGCDENSTLHELFDYILERLNKHYNAQVDGITYQTSGKVWRLKNYKDFDEFLANDGYWILMALKGSKRYHTQPYAILEREVDVCF